MTTLREAFDNATKSSDKWEPYFDVYERHLGWIQFMSKPITLVEVGVQKGGSLEMWKEYVGPWGKVIGIDIDPICANLQYNSPNAKVVIGDQGDPAFWDSFLKDHKSIDIFIDDGGHFMDQQVLTFEKVFPTMPLNSVYICEDCHTSYMSYNGGGLGVKSSFIEYAKSLVDVIHKSWLQEMDSGIERKFKLVKDLTSIHFYDSMVVFEKRGKQDMIRVCPKEFTQDKT